MVKVEKDGEIPQVFRNGLFNMIKRPECPIKCWRGVTSERPNARYLYVWCFGGLVGSKAEKFNKS